jgi:hypothetical protein
MNCAAPRSRTRSSRLISTRSEGAASLRSDTKKAAKDAESEEEEALARGVDQQADPADPAVRKGDVVMPVLIATVGKEHRRDDLAQKPISPARGRC